MKETPIPNSGRKLFFGLFVFPLLIAVGMIVLLSSVVLMTTERETPESLIAAIKTGKTGKRSQKAYELSNELNRSQKSLRKDALINEIILILRDPSYDPGTRRYMAIALSHFDSPEATRALREALNDGDEDVRLYALWSLGVLRDADARVAVENFLSHEDPDMRKMASYVIGVVGNKESTAKLKPLLENAEPDVRWNAALSLARLGDDSGHSVLKEMLARETFQGLSMDEEDIEKVMINATKGLALIGKTDNLLQNIASQEKNLRVRQAAMEAIQFAGDKR